MNEEIEKLFKNFVVPVSYIRDDSDAATYMTYQQVNATPALEADDACQEIRYEYDFDVYSKSNLTLVFDSAKELLKNADWAWVEDGPDIYEDETGYYHKTATFAVVK